MEPQPSQTPALSQQPENQAASDSTSVQVPATTPSSIVSPVPTFDCSTTISQDSFEGGSRSGGADVQTIREKAAQLQKQFENVLKKTKTSFRDEKKGKSQSFLSKLRDTLTTLPLSERHQHLLFLKQEKDRIINAKDTDEIFDILEHHWNYIDYNFLEYLINEFGTKKLQREMNRYILELEQSEKKMIVQDFDSAVLDQRNLPAHFKTITITQSKDPAKCSLYEVRQFRNVVVKRSTLTGYTVYMYLKGPTCGSVKIFLAYPPEAHTELLKVFCLQFKKSYKCKIEPQTLLLKQKVGKGVHVHVPVPGRPGTVEAKPQHPSASKKPCQGKGERIVSLLNPLEFHTASPTDTHLSPNPSVKERKRVSGILQFKYCFELHL